ncbi:cadherin-related family member 1 [Engraulis encrasicolus]|uniref:cadherin-related family member 1 n=1 Tax=Engraulis encrasicolus TaxID=184585 RepID=UPI002FD62E6A
MIRTGVLLLLTVLHLTRGQSDDYAPYFYDNGPESFNGNMALFSISEDTPVGTLVYVLNGTDPEGDEVRYDITFDKGSKEYLTVDPKTGNVTLASALDREHQDEISALVSITDGRNKVVEKVRVFVTDANDEAPEFLNLPFIVDVYENAPEGTSLYRVQATDRDLGSGGSVSYFLQNATTSKFSIDSHHGILRIKAGETLDYETTRTHFVTVLAKDGGGKYNDKYHVMTASATITINVLDSQDTPPSFVGTPYFAYVYEVSGPGSEIFTVLAKDGDEGNPNPIHYSFADDSGGPFFGIDSTTGTISLLSQPVALRNELYELNVKAAERGLDNVELAYAITMVTIRVVDLNNHPPTFYGENGPQSRFELTMYEHPPEGEILRGLKITVNDSDQGANAKFRLRLVGPGKILRVVPQTVLNEAQVTIIVENSTAIDYERYQFITFKLLAVEIDTPEKFSATADIIINLLDTNDNIPHFSSEFYIARIPENSPGGSNVVAVTASDPDSGLWGEVKYSIYGSGSDLFLIHPSSGIIYTQPWAALDAEVKSKYNFYVKAEDTEGKYALAEVFVTVLDCNDHPPSFPDNFMEKTMVIGAPVRIEAVDDDAEQPNNVIEYSIMRTDPDNIFEINKSTGEIHLKPYIKSMEIVQNITKHKDCKWSLVVQARDRGKPSFSTTAVIKIDITEATPLKGPLATFLMQGRESPLKALCMITGLVSIMVLLTVVISTAMYMRNNKSNRIMPVRRIIRKRRDPPCPAFNFRALFMRQTITEDDYDDGSTEGDPEEGPKPPKPPKPPCAPRLPVPPPPAAATYRPSHERQWPVPTISGTLATRGSRRSRHGGGGGGGGGGGNEASNALVSELKMRLEQKIKEANKGGYYY